MKFIYQRENGDVFDYAVSNERLKFALREVMAEIYKGATGDNLKVAISVMEKILEDIDDYEYLAEVYNEELTEYFRDDALEYDASESADEIEASEYNRVRFGGIN